MVFFVYFSQMMAKFLPKVACYSLQVRILKIIFSYVKAPHEYVESLFKSVIPNQPHGILHRFKSYNRCSDRQKQVIMYRDLPNEINRKEKKVYSKVMRHLYFDDEATVPYPVSNNS